MWLSLSPALSPEIFGPVIARAVDSNRISRHLFHLFHLFHLTTQLLNTTILHIGPLQLKLLGSNVGMGSSQSKMPGSEPAKSLPEFEALRINDVNLDSDSDFVYVAEKNRVLFLSGPPKSCK